MKNSNFQNAFLKNCKFWVMAVLHYRSEMIINEGSSLNDNKKSTKIIWQISSIQVHACITYTLPTSSWSSIISRGPFRSPTSQNLCTTWHSESSFKLLSNRWRISFFSFKWNSAQRSLRLPKSSQMLSSFLMNYQSCNTNHKF